MTAEQAVLERDFDVYVQGSGPALLLAHGAGGGIAGNFGLVLDDLAKDHAVIGPHYPGAGGTPVTTKPMDLDKLADALVASAVARGHETFTVLGESLGTTVAVRAATRHPDRVTGLVLTAGFPVADPVLAHASHLIALLGKAGEWDEVARLALLACLSESQLDGMSPAEVAEGAAQVKASLPAGMLDHFDLVSRVDVRRDLTDVTAPTLVFAPTGDRLVLPESSRRLAAGIRGATLIELPGAGHILDAEHRAHWLGHVRRFLTSLGAISA
ncbi:alpha/beta fold hydrolase [Streptomyces sp. NPDC058534]|uniref:alpha/beta fold hydrolase n=1 Tax=Streptomyces sp. NPDC058534 TaxID=3346541 RepID=UPI00365FA543